MPKKTEEPLKTYIDVPRPEMKKSQSHTDFSWVNLKAKIPKSHTAFSWLHKNRRHQKVFGNAKDTIITQSILAQLFSVYLEE